MGLLKNIFGSNAAVTQLPSGSIAVNRAGKIVSSTVSSAYPAKLLQAVGKEVLALLREARAAQMPRAEGSIHFASLRVTAQGFLTFVTYGVGMFIGSTLSGIALDFFTTSHGGAASPEPGVRESAISNS